MIRLFIVVEGLTEELFVNDVLTPHLANFGIYPKATMIGLGQKGGKVNLARLADHLKKLTRNQPREVWFTTMLDFDKFHELKVKAQGTDPWARADHAEVILETELRKRECVRERFIPYVQLHDFEALVLAEPMKLLEQFPKEGPQFPGEGPTTVSPAMKTLEKLMQSIQGTEPEGLNHDKPPCKRIEEFFPTYPKNKATKSALIAKAIGLPKLRVRCPHFGKWLAKIESLAGDQDGPRFTVTLR